MNISMHNNRLGFDLQMDLCFFMPDWIGKFVCKRKDHSWEIFGDVCDRCGVEYECIEDDCEKYE